MGTFLSKELGKYYERAGNRIIFKNGMSLNQLALSMWERLGYREVDASVVSRVIHGERFFTPSQLQVFCELLSILKSEREYLFYCLNLDNCAQYGVVLDEKFLNSNDAFDFIGKLLNNTHEFIFNGNFRDIYWIGQLAIDYLNRLFRRTLDGSSRKKIYELFGLAYYLKGRAIGGFVLPKEATRQLLPIAGKIYTFAKESKNKKHFGFAHMISSHAYYISGNYSLSKRNRQTYLQAIRHVKKELSYYSLFQSENIFAYRTLIVCTINTHDKEAFLSVRKEALNFLKNVSLKYYVNGIHLYHAIARGEAIFGLMSALDTHEAAYSYFGKTLEGTRVLELSDIRNELEILSILKVKDENYIRKKAERALDIAKEEGCIRHIKNINKLSEKLLG